MFNLEIHDGPIGFVHQKLLDIGAGLIPGGRTALGIGRALVGGGRKKTKKAQPRILLDLGLADDRRREITKAMQAARKRGDLNEARAFLRELGSQGALGPAAPVKSVALVSRNLGLTDERRREITKAMQAARKRGDINEARTFLRELGSQGALAPLAPIVTAKPITPAGLPEMIHQRFGGQDGCIVPGMRRDPRTGNCAFFIGDQTGRDDSPVGEAIMGRFGAGYMPGSMVVDRAVCLPGDVVGQDGLCYPKSCLKNTERAWPAGRRPLLTGGEMRAISTASRAAGRLTRTHKRLEKMGMLAKTKKA